MSWKTVLKEIRMDNKANCCEEARMKIIEWFEEHIEKLNLESNPNLQFKDYLETLSLDYSEYSCDELYKNTVDFMLIKNSAMTFYDWESLQKIVDDWDKCKEEPIKEKSPKKEYDWYKQTGDDTTAWMDKYFATGRA